MTVSISNIEDKARGKLLTVTAGNFSVQILFLSHALERIETWDLTLEIVAETLLYPEEVVVGHRDRFIAHKRYEPLAKRLSSPKVSVGDLVFSNS
jgi:hypothetical protein